MDEQLLETKGIVPSAVRLGLVHGFGLRIGERATLVPCPTSRAYGVVMDVEPSSVRELYGEESVRDYVPEAMSVELMDGTVVEATCYNLPRDKVTGANKNYAQMLLDVASRLGLPDSYLDEIRELAN